MTVNTHEAKSRLSELIRIVESGEEVVIARAGHPVARLVAATSPRPSRTPGALRGQIRIHGDLVTSDPEIVEQFEALS